MKFTKPKIFKVAETQLCPEDLQRYFDYMDVPDWQTDAPSDSEALIEIAGKLCYLSYDESLNKNLTRVRKNQNHDYIQNGIIKVNHGSVLEHTSVTFILCDVSRIFTHELVRHRAGCAYSQVSGRFVRLDEIDCYLPECFDEDQKLQFYDIMSNIEIMYKDFETNLFKNIGTNFSEKKTLTSALRRMLPNGQNNHIMITANHRALRHIVDMRTTEHAEEEIKLVFDQIRDILISDYPNIYHDMRLLNG